MVLAVVGMLAMLACLSEAKIVEGTTYTDEQVWNMLQNYMTKSSRDMDGGFEISNRHMHYILENLPMYQQLKAQFDP